VTAQDKQQLAAQLANLAREVRGLTEHIKRGPTRARDMSGLGLKEELQRLLRRKEDTDSDAT